MGGNLPRLLQCQGLTHRLGLGASVLAAKLQSRGGRPFTSEAREVPRRLPWRRRTVGPIWRILVERSGESRVLLSPSRGLPLLRDDGGLGASRLARRH